MGALDKEASMVAESQFLASPEELDILFLSQNIWIKEHLLLLCPLKTMQYFSG